MGVDSRRRDRLARLNELEAPVLEMRPTCERCEARLPENGAAQICSFECTFCSDCGIALDHVCPNCGGELVARPRRLG